MRFNATGYTSAGAVKDTNQDSYLIKVAETSFGDVSLIAVADGMGGLAKGELASATAVRMLSEWFEEKLPLSLEMMASSVEGFEQFVEGQWNGIVQELNLKIMRHGAQERINLGTTLTTFLSVGARFSILHVGDTRVYEITNEQATVLTKDQTFIRREIDAGRLTQEEAIDHPQRNVLLQCIGSSKEVKPDILHGNLKQNATYLVCSDGFRHELHNKDLIERFSPGALSSLCEADSDDWTLLATKALKEACMFDMERGERDNLTAVLIQAGEGY